MADIGKSLKGIWLKGMEAVSNTASSIASNTKYKVEEMNILNRRREILSDFGAQAYELWQKGEQFPATLAALLEELSKLDETLNAIRTEKLAGVKTEAAEETDEVPEGPAEEESAEMMDNLSDVEADDLPAEEAEQDQPDEPAAEENQPEDSAPEA